MAETFEGKVVLITGAGSGLGRAASFLFVNRGAKVVVGDINAESGQDTVDVIKKAGGEALFVKVDVAKEAEVEALVSKAVRTYGRLDCAFNNVGILGGGSITETTEEEWDRVIDANLKGTWLCMKYEVKYMLEHGGGAIVNTSSIAGMVGAQDAAAYPSSKWGVVGLTKSAALTYAKDNIRINALCPGGMADTGMAHTIMGEITPPGADPTGAKVPIGRKGTVDEVAEGALWLCSDAASYVIGHALLVDGGFTVP